MVSFVVSCQAPTCIDRVDGERVDGDGDCDWCCSSSGHGLSYNIIRHVHQDNGALTILFRGMLPMLGAITSVAMAMD